MIQFKRLTLNGFKSFVDKTELAIEPGLTGIVGPNGCGKSNLVEALRWVMGENSAKRMRGGGMDDIIFSGTSSRPARSLAEVNVLLDNASKSAPAAYNGSEEIEISRKIQREHGSSYRINGQVSRAHDVQVLFADVLSGSNSPAMVSQGQITRIISAKPQERRLMLEDSAGIGGLYARRHEAELRLRSAETNLERIEDILGSMESRLAALKKQARQASRYRNISGQIRQLDLAIAWLDWNALSGKLKETKAAFEQAESVVADKTASVVQLTKTQSAQMQDLPALRKADTDAAAELQNLQIRFQRLEDEIRQAETLLNDSREQLNQTRTDREEETQTQTDIAAQLEKLLNEFETITRHQTGAEDELEKRAEVRNSLESKVQRLESDYSALLEQAADLRARKNALEQTASAEQKRLEETVSQIQSLSQQKAHLQNNTEDFGKRDALQAEIIETEDRLTTLREILSQKEIERAALQDNAAKARSACYDKEKEKERILAEISTLEDYLKEEHKEQARTIIEDVHAGEGFEAALSKALGDCLGASTDKESPRAMLGREMEQYPPLPAGVTPISLYVDGPAVLDTALSQVGIVETEEAGFSMQSQLLPGQTLVTRAGALWRWDGLHIKASAIDRHAVHLQQKNRLADLEKRQAQISRDAEKAGEVLEAAENLASEINGFLAAKQSERSAMEDALARKRGAYQKLSERLQTQERELARIEEALSLKNAEQSRIEESLKTAQSALTDLKSGDADDQQNRMDKMRASLQTIRDELRGAVRAYDLCKQQQETREVRLRAIGDERVNLQNRLIRSREKLKSLEEREKTLQEKVGALENAPSDIQKGRQDLLDRISRAEQKRNQTANALNACESAVSETNDALKKAESVLAEARERRAGLQATFAAGKQRIDEIHAEILEKFEIEPHLLKDHIAFDVEEYMESGADEFRARRDKLTRERDNIGPVNLRADTEAEELEKELTGLLNERNDLIQAISELRQGINKLNNEARQRLSIAFEHVNAHFTSLFTRLFGGGTAYLSLIESEDPLNAGLEIYGQPPGKSLQAMSLLSGGEQTLTSIALIFAMFLTNPSPICVLDEIDAPLDDANVDRVCDLLDEMAESGKTRFLIITHHRLTMARMDRLYGVTMAERGISQLVSVDLQQSFGFMEAAE